MKRTLRGMLNYLALYKALFVVGQIAMLVGTAAGLAFPWMVRNVFDVLFQTQHMNALLIAIGGLAAVSVVGELANFVKNRALGHIGQKMIRDLRANIYERLLHLSLDYYDNQNSGDITSSMTNDMALLQQGLSSGLTYILQQALSLIAVVVLLFSIDAVLTLIVCATIPIILIISQKMGAKVKAIAKSTQERLGYLMNILNQSVSGISVIQAFVLENYAQGLFRDENERILDQSIANIKVTTTAGLFIGLLNALFLLVVIGIGALRVTGGYLTPANLIAFILYAEMVAGPVAALSGIYIEINRAVAAYQRIAAILETPAEVENRPTGSLDAVRGRIEFRDVTFSYDGEKPILENISFSVAPGETVALVGPSGAGKSTLAKLLPRFYDPDAGTILLDGVDIRTLDLQFLRQQIAIVPQETYLFGMSIRDNIACGQPEASAEAIERAARLANADGFIREQDHGYDTEIGERGARLSGGQRQRIAIARAFLKDPRILILDEATSALDAHAERQIQDALTTLMRDRATLIIAHRLSTIENADKIVVLKDGSILATGTHGDLLETCPFYRDLYQKQFALTLPRLIQEQG
ncbi:MAG TPA: ABC transporter ATP-binding protein [Anaerolineae bacterium]|nr:ABC transporter ATP-binding protein [Anaerolineae bacterium]HQI86131.1 ABC transporter ATP-binding protein [Anaerolineae bacterium]